MDLQTDGLLTHEYGTTENDDADEELNNHLSELSGVDGEKAKSGIDSSLIDGSASVDVAELKGVKRPREFDDLHSDSKKYGTIMIDSDGEAPEAGNRSPQMGEATKSESQISSSSDSDSDDSDADIGVIAR